MVPGSFPLSENNGKYDSEALIRRSSGPNTIYSQSVSPNSYQNTNHKLRIYRKNLGTMSIILSN